VAHAARVRWETRWSRVALSYALRYARTKLVLYILCAVKRLHTASRREEPQQEQVSRGKTQRQMALRREELRNGELQPFSI